MTPEKLIEAFVSHLADSRRIGLKIDRWPDRENRTGKDIDAIAGTIAIEHTSIDTLSNQRRDSDWYMQAVGGLEAELTDLDFHLWIVIDYEAVSAGQDWGAIRSGLRSWILQETPKLADGHHVVRPANVPFELDLTKESEGRLPRCFFVRRVREDLTLPRRVRELCDRKAIKLATYRSDGFTTVLLLETDDIALMNESKLREAVLEAYPDHGPSGVDQFWYANSSIPSQIEFHDWSEIWAEEADPDEATQGRL